MENGPFIDNFPIKISIYKGFFMAMLNNQMVYFLIILIVVEWHFQGLSAMSDCQSRGAVAPIFFGGAP